MRSIASNLRALLTLPLCLAALAACEIQPADEAAPNSVAPTGGSPSLGKPGGVDPSTSCDDGDACTEDAEDLKKGCVHTPIACDDGHLCQVMGCDPKTGCFVQAKGCDDGDACTKDTCTSKGCEHVSTCEDGNPCTEDVCDAAKGSCNFVAVDCDDGDACTVDSCDKASGECTSEEISCVDGNKCTTDLCDPETGVCDNPPIDCEDGNPCTEDSCDLFFGCLHPTKSCDDGDPCTEDSCDPQTGECSSWFIDCDDEDPCTQDVCDAGACTHTLKDCDDDVWCTEDFCDESGVCVNAGLDALCNDGNACTIDTCEADGCANSASGPGTCDDSVPDPGQVYAGVWHSYAGGGPDRQVLADLALDSVADLVESKQAQGYELVDLDARHDWSTGLDRFDAVFEEGAPQAYYFVTSDLAVLESYHALYKAQGIALQDIEIWLSSEPAIRYAGLWAGSGDTVMTLEVSWDEINADRFEKIADGYVMTDLHVFEGFDVVNYSAVYEKSSESSPEVARVLVGLTWDEFAKQWWAYDDERLIDIEIYGPEEAPLYAGLWSGSSLGDRVVGGRSWEHFDRLDKAIFPYKRLVDVERRLGHPVPPVAFSSKIQEDLGNLAVGYTYAIAKDGRLVGYGSNGFARAPWEAEDPGVEMRPWTNMTLWSISKAITASAFFTLSKGGESYAQELFYDYLEWYLPDAGAGIPNITFEQLFTHTSGIDPLTLEGKGCGDGADFGTNLAALVAADTENGGGEYDYQNANYCLIRGAMESITGQPYEDFVREAVFTPMGVNPGFTIERDAVTPTVYYNTLNAPIEEPGNPGLEGPTTEHLGPLGWFGSSVGLIRWLIGVRNHTVLSPERTDEMLTGKMGWFTASTSAGTAYTHNGTGVGDAGGYTGNVMRLPGGYDAVLLVNTIGIEGSPGVDPRKRLLDAFERLMGMPD